MKWCISFPEETLLIVRPSLVAICYGCRPAAKLLSVLLYRYSLRQETKTDAQNLNEIKVSQGQFPDQDTTYRIFRKQEQLVDDMCGEITEKTLHDVAVPALCLLGYLDIEEHMQCNCYELHLGAISLAMDCHKSNKDGLEKFLISNLQLEKFLISTEWLNEETGQLEKVLIDKKYFLSQLEKVLIQIRKSSNCKRGRRGNPEATSKGKSKKDRLYRDCNRDITSRESNSASFDDAPSSSLSEENHLLQTENAQLRALLAQQQGDHDAHHTDSMDTLPACPSVGGDNALSGHAVEASVSSTSSVPPTDHSDHRPGHVCSGNDHPASELEGTSPTPVGREAQVNGHIGSTDSALAPAASQCGDSGMADSRAFSQPTSQVEPTTNTPPTPVGRNNARPSQSGKTSKKEEKVTQVEPAESATSEKPERKPLEPPAESMEWGVEKAMLWANYFRKFPWPVKKYANSKHQRALEAAEMIIQRGITEKQFTYVFKYMKGLLKDQTFKSEYWTDKEVDIWTVNDHFENQFAEVKRRRAEKEQATARPSVRSIDPHRDFGGLTYFPCVFEQQQQAVGGGRS